LIHFYKRVNLRRMSDHEDTSKDESKAPAAGEDYNPSAGEDSNPPLAGEDSNPPGADDETNKETSGEKDDETKATNGSNADNGVSNEWKTNVEKLADVVEEMKEFVYRTDISATEKVNHVKRLIDVAQNKPKEEPKPVESNKRPAGEGKMGEPMPKMKKKEIGEDGEVINNSDDEDQDIDSCVVCGLYLEVFKDNKDKELQHYLSHGFNILKEFEILKPDDALFLCCNLCTSIYPRKCHVNYRKHLVSDHTDRIVEIFREV